MVYRILLVDDSATVRRVLRKALDLVEVPVSGILEATNGQEALDILDKEWVDIVFADINMPVMDGETMILKMNDSGLLQDIPVIIISSEGSETRIQKLKDLGVRGFVRKPFRPEMIRDIIEEVMVQCHEK